MSYTAAVDHLYALGHELAPAQTPAQTPTATAPRRKFDLAHMRVLAEALGNPQAAFPSVLIAGTNGKGSTAATLAAILTTAGYRTALYTSPHLVRVNERIQIDGIQIPDDDFARLYFHVDDTAQRLVREGALPHHPSFFETLTALAFLYFAGRQGSGIRDQESENRVPHPSLHRRESGSLANAFVRGGEEGWDEQTPVDIAILEVGLGGRLDATNIVDPILSVITDISLDHQEYLGHTIAEITREKAGILRPHGTLITLPQHPEANQAIGEAAASLNLRAISAAQFIPHNPVSQPQIPVILNEAKNPGISPDAPQTSAAAEAPKAPPPLTPNRYILTLDNEPLEVQSPLSGHHQQRNIALAIAAAVELRNQNGYTYPQTRNRASYNITNQAIEAGIRNTRWPGRLELIPGHPPILLDVAHNPAGAWTLRAAIAQLPENQPRTLLFSCLRDKALAEIAQILFPLFDATGYRPCDHIVFTPVNNPRTATLETLLAAAHALDIPAHAAPDVSSALDKARAFTPPDGLILATGSVYLVGEVRHLALHGGKPSA